MVPITNDFVQNLVELGQCLNATALRHNLDILDIKVEPEFGYVYVSGKRDDREVLRAIHWDAANSTEIKIAPQVAATTTGAGN